MSSWYPHPGPQTEFCARGEFEVLFGGAAGPGKTDCLIMEATRFVENPNYKAVIFRRTFPQLQEIIDRCWQWYPRLGATYRTTEHRWYFPTGSTINLGHMQHETDKYNHQGKEYQFVGFDELTQFLSAQYLYLISRVRTTDKTIPVRVRATTNPGGGGHHWVRERFIVPAKPLETYIDPKSGHSRCFVPATIYDNPTLMESDPEYISRLEALPEVEKMRLLYGNWDAFEGQVFDELSQQIHGCEPFPIPLDWEKFCVFDWGYSRPWAALWFAVDYDGDLYLYRAFYAMKKGDDGKFDPNKGLRQTNIEICREILKRENEKMSFRVADPACWAPTKQRGSNIVLGPSFVEDAAKEGLFWLKADNDRLRGKQQVHMRFRVEEETDPETGEVIEERARFHAFLSDEHGGQGVKRWWDEIQNLQEDPKNPEDVDTDQPDEGYDCTRYAFMSRPLSPKPLKRIPSGSFAAERQRLIRAKAYARRHGVSLVAAYQRVR
jgi:hypothetical protein